MPPNARRSECKQMAYYETPRFLVAWQRGALLLRSRVILDGSLDPNLGLRRLARDKFVTTRFAKRLSSSLSKDGAARALPVVAVFEADDASIKRSY